MRSTRVLPRFPVTCSPSTSTPPPFLLGRYLRMPALAGVSRVEPDTGTSLVGMASRRVGLPVMLEMVFPAATVPPKYRNAAPRIPAPTVTVPSAFVAVPAVASAMRP